MGLSRFKARRLVEHFSSDADPNYTSFWVKKMFTLMPDDSKIPDVSDLAIPLVSNVY